jgi:hypothetical protein
LITELLGEHRMLELLVRKLQTADSRSLAAVLRDFATALEAHIRKEERLLFPVYEKEIPTSVAEQVGLGVLTLIGTALHPRRPELLSEDPVRQGGAFE